MSVKTRQNSTKSPTIEMLCVLAGFITSVLAELSFQQVQNLLSHKNTLLRKKLMEVFEIVTAVTVDPFVDLRAEWQKFYADHFGLAVNFSETTIPTRPTEGSWRLLFIPTRLTMNTTLAGMRKLFKVWVYTENMDGNITTNTRTSATCYAVWVRDGMEPDDKYLGKSTRQADMDGVIGVTLLERLVFGVKYFTETGKHLDVKGITLCTGSRNSDGNVPYVYWHSDTGEVNVHWFSVDNSLSAHGLRQAVSR